MNKSLIEVIKKEANKNFDSIVDIRRHLHKNPELSFQEYETSKYIQNVFYDRGIILQDTKYAETGLVVTIQGKNPDSKTVALRSDIDALPLLEHNDIAYKSKNEGVMHACGHDIHTASLINCALILNALKDKFEGSVRCIFQPAEEVPPGGAITMIKNGVLKNPVPKVILGQHVSPLVPAGKVAFTKDIILASNANIVIKIHGEGGHAASPHLAVDTILVASHVILALQQLISRNTKPITPSVLSLCTINGGEANNVLPEEVIITGTFRTLDTTWRDIALKKIKKLACKIADAMGAKCDFEIQKGYPCTKNDNKVTERAIENSKIFLGENNVLEREPSMGSEDFSYYLQKIPGCFYWLGTQNKEKNIDSYVHTSTFDADEKSLTIGSSLMCWLALNELTS